MTVEVAQEHLAWNVEAVERCGVLSTEAAAPSHVRRLFHAVPQQAPNGALLHQVSKLVLAGLAAGLDACKRACEAPYGNATAGSSARSAVTKAAATVSRLLLPA